jgi:hypothetical protein
MSVPLALTKLNQSFDEKYGHLVRNGVYFGDNPILQLNITPTYSVLLLGLFFDHENGGDIFARYLLLSSKQQQFAGFFFLAWLTLQL